MKSLSVRILALRGKPKKESGPREREAFRLGHKQARLAAASLVATNYHNEGLFRLQAAALALLRRVDARGAVQDFPMSEWEPLRHALSRVSAP